MNLPPALQFVFGFRTTKAKLAFAAHQVLAKLGALEDLRTALRRSVGGSFADERMRAEFRPGTWDAWTAHPGHEPETHAWIAATFVGETMIDVGAYCGTFSLRHTKTFDHIVAFEASSNNFSALQKNIRLSEMCGKIYPARAAVGDIEGTARLYLNSPDTHSTVECAQTRYESVAAITLDGFNGNGVGRVALLKIDVEGGEAAVLRGATKFLAAHKPSILAEANSAGELATLSALLAPTGYGHQRTLDGRNHVFVRT